MEVEPNFSRLSFDMSLSEADKLVQQDTPADTVHSSVFNTPSEATMAMVVDPVSANVSSQDGFTVADSNLIDESSFFEGGDLSTNNVMLQDDEDFWRGIDQELLAFQSASCTRPNKNEMLLASPVDGSSFPWQDSSAHEPGYLFTESNVCSEITLSGCEQELFGPSTMGYQVLDFTDANPASMNAADEYDPIGCLNYTFPNEHGIYTDLALSVQLDGTVNSWLGNQYSDDRGDMSDPNLYIRPDVLALISPYRSPLSQPNHPKNRTTDEDHELLTTVDIADNLQVNPPPSRPIPAFDDLIVNFDLNPRPPPSKRKRSSFTRAGKEKVRLVRDSGACVFCRSRKVSVSIFPCCVPLAWLILTSTSALQKKYATNVDELLTIRL
jgi:hypothetical protein